MGIDWHTARFLIGARESGVDFARTATLGRQNLFVSPQEIGNLFGEYAVSPPLSSVVTTCSEFADNLFKALGATTYVPIDASAYEGAVEVHDMNASIPDRLRSAFDTVVDGGTLEHVFNFPTAIRNCMEMVRVGGHLILQTPANNFCGHGFYQFSPELYYRVLSPENGFQVERMIAYEPLPHRQWYEVTDPAQLGSRVELIGSDHRVLLLVRAKRVKEKPIFDNWPQQSDYAAAWMGEQRTTPEVASGFGIRREPGLLRRLGWAALRCLGPSGLRAVHNQRTRFLNRQLGLSAQPGVFRPTSK